MAPDPDSDLLADQELTAALRDALERREFLLLYQPTIDLQSKAFVGVEALLRWRHPTRGLVSPDGFLPALESTGLIIPVGAWVLRSACLQGADWFARGYRFSVSVNVARTQLESASFAADVVAALDSSAFDPAHLVLEFSERTLTDGKDAVAAVARLASTGVRVAVDDFGMEPESASLLDRFPIDVIKIDRRVVSDLATSESHTTRIHQLVQLGKLRNVQTVAQGIEDDDQRLRVQGEDVDVGQGFLFSVPHDAEAIDRFLEDYAIFSGKPL